MHKMDVALLLVANAKAVHVWMVKESESEFLSKAKTNSISFLERPLGPTLAVVDNKYP